MLPECHGQELVDMDLVDRLRLLGEVEANFGVKGYRTITHTVSVILWIDTPQSLLAAEPIYHNGKRSHVLESNAVCSEILLSINAFILDCAPFICMICAFTTSKFLCDSTRPRWTSRNSAFAARLDRSLSCDVCSAMSS